MYKPRVVIVEGTDRTGKSTILNELVKLGYPRLHWDGVRNSGVKDLHDPALAKLSKLSFEIQIAFFRLMKTMGVDSPFVMDRGPYSELAYSKRFGRKCMLKRLKVESALLANDVVLVLLLCGEDELKRRFERSPDMYVSYDDAVAIQNIYWKLFKKSILRKTYVFVDGKTPKFIAAEIGGMLLC